MAARTSEHHLVLTGNYTTNLPPRKDLEIRGTGNYKFEGKKVLLSVEKIVNNRDGGNSGTLYLSLWATNYKYNGGTITGHEVAWIKPDQLSGGESRTGIRDYGFYSEPSAGWYNLTLALQEWNGSSYQVFDWINFDSKLFLGKEIQLSGGFSYSISNDTVNIKVGKVANNRSGGNSGSLKLGLWATSSPFSGGNISGHQIASHQLSCLDGGHDYSNIDTNVTYSVPPSAWYYVVLFLSEYKDGGWIWYDYLQADSMHFLGKKRQLSNPVSYSFEGDNKIRLKAEKIANKYHERCGSLKIVVWASTAQYYPGCPGYTLGTYQLDPLEGNQNYTNINRLVDYTPPPGGWYYITMKLQEHNQGWYVADYIKFSNQKFLGKEIELVGGFSYNHCDDYLWLKVNKIKNNRSGGKTGSLRLELWATTSRFTGGSINGYVLGRHQFEGLDGGHSYTNIDRRVQFIEPPSGVFYLTMTISEYNSGYTIRDYYTFDHAQTIDSSSCTII